MCSAHSDEIPSQLSVDNQETSAIAAVSATDKELFCCLLYETCVVLIRFSKKFTATLSLLSQSLHHETGKAEDIGESDSTSDEGSEELSADHIWPSIFLTTTIIALFILAMVALIYGFSIRGKSCISMK